MPSRGGERTSLGATPVATATGDCGTQGGIGQGVAAAALHMGSPISLRVGELNCLAPCEPPGGSAQLP